MTPDKKQAPREFWIEFDEHGHTSVLNDYPRSPVAEFKYVQVREVTGDSVLEGLIEPSSEERSKWSEETEEYVFRLEQAVDQLKGGK